MDDSSFFEYLHQLYFLLIEFHCTSSISYTILTNFVYYCCILIRIVGFFLFVPALLLSILTSLCLHSSSITSSYFILSLPMRESWGKLSCMSPPFPIAILNGTCFFLTVQLQVHNVYSELKIRNSL